MEEMWNLVYHGKLTKTDLCYMNAEDRRWWLVRCKKHFEDTEKASKGNNSSGMPSRGGRP